MEVVRSDQTLGHLGVELDGWLTDWMWGVREESRTAPRIESDRKDGAAI